MLMDGEKWNKKALDYVLRKRDEALSCTVCECKLFDFMKCIDQFIHKNNRKLVYQHELIRGIHLYVFNHYNYQMYDGGLVRHHTNYKKGITIPVCDTCHKKIHHSKDSRYTKYLPVDERPKDKNKIVYNLYKTLKS